MTRRLLVLGASSLRASAFTSWQRMGLDVVLVDGHSPARYEHLADEFHALDARDTKAGPSPAVEQLGELARSCDGVTTLADNSQLTAATVAELAGLPGIGVAAATAARSKLVQRSHCAAAGLRVPRWCQVRKAEDLDGFFADGPVPAVIKPVDSAGSAGVFRVENLSQARGEWPVTRSLSPSRTVLIEEFLAGREICVEAVVQEGEPVFVSVCDAEIAGPVGFIAVAAKYDGEHPLRAGAAPAVRAVAAALGLQDGIVHAEFKVDDGTWTVLETAFRPGGALVPDLTQRVTGVSLYRAQAQLALGDRVAAEVPGAQPTRYAQVRFLVADGQVRRGVTPAAVVRDLPDVKVVVQLAPAGRRVRVPVSDEGRAAYALGWGEDAHRLERQLHVALGRMAREMGLTVIAGTDHVAA